MTTFSFWSASPNGAGFAPRPDLMCFHSASDQLIIGKWKRRQMEAEIAQGTGILWKDQQAHGRRSETF
jgi:hypothetical protein